ncbi:MAG: hypothetical protein CFH33_01544 [Alphaproteobacteria bacterium MarineAlpha9_Bin3]|nr:MAG: hypothetical protein CFH33_01544 [Alphaproteobacteria bacterium MarineAlpha9_Bin3]|tara:strand:- start:305 stop:1411 length:1107 start_codon:yes stop_codon:yes gene_type:complete
MLYFKAKLIALKRRLHLLFFNDFNPYPKAPDKLYLSPSDIINNYENSSQKLKYKSSESDLAQWKNTTRLKLKKILSINKELYCKEVISNKIIMKKGYSRKRIYLEFSKYRHAPIDIIVNENIKKYKGIILCMQGTNSGAHLNLGEVKMPADIFKVKNGSDIAIQAAKLGFIAISFERIGFGERRELKLNKRNFAPEIDFSFHSLLYGKTSLGETVSELSVLVKWLKNKYSNKYKIWLKGYSSAGTTAIAAAAIDKNIDGIAIGGCVGLSNDTILKRGGTGYNHLPDLLNWFDQDVMISLISPRPCIIVSGVKDHIWPYKYAIKAIKVPKAVYKKENSEKNLSLIKAGGGHTYYPHLLWPEIIKVIEIK